MKRLPVLFFDTPGANCLIFAGSAALGESSDALCMPMGENTSVYIVVHPLSSCPEGILLPMAFKVALNNGQLSHPLPEGVFADMLSDGRINITISLAVLPSVCAEPELLCEARPLSPDGPLYARLWREDGAATLYIDGEKGALCSCCVGDIVSAKLETGRILSADADDILLSGETRTGSMTFLFSADKDYAPVISERGAPELHDRHITCSEALGDTARHIRRAEYSLANGVFVPAVSYSAERKPDGMEGIEAALSLCEALRLGLPDEALSYLTPSYGAGISAEELWEFFGDFDALRPVSYDAGVASIMLGCPVYDNVRRFKNYLFTIRNGRIDRIDEE